MPQSNNYNEINQNEANNFQQNNQQTPKFVSKRNCLFLLLMLLIPLTGWSILQIPAPKANHQSISDQYFLSMLTGSISLTQNNVQNNDRDQPNQGLINFSEPYRRIQIITENKTFMTLNYSNRILKGHSSPNSSITSQIKTKIEQFQSTPQEMQQIRALSIPDLAIKKFINIGKKYEWVDYYEYSELSKTYKLDQAISENNFCVISPFRNILLGQGQLKYLQLYMNSLEVQNYSNFKVIMIDDNSEDNSTQGIAQILKHNFPRFRERLMIVQNLDNVGALGNRDIAVRNYCEDSSIVLQLDADDFLIGKQVLNVLNRVYTKNSNFWFVYTNHLGMMYETRDKQGMSIVSKNMGGNREINSQILSKNSYRLSPLSWVTSHLKTYLRNLYIKIPLSYLMYNGSYYTQSTDRFNIYSIVELAGRKHTFFLNQTFYLYNYPSHATRNCQDELRSFLNYKSSTLPPLQPLENLNESAIIGPEFRDVQEFKKMSKIKQQLYNKCLQDIRNHTKGSIGK